MASLKEVKTRINSVQSTRKITSAMKMVASAKLHKAQGAIENMSSGRVSVLCGTSRQAGRYCGFFFQQFFMRCFQCECTENVFADGGRISRVGTR